MTRQFARSLLLLALASLANPVIAGETLLVLASQPGDYIGGGQQRVISTSEADFFVSRNFDNGVSFNINDFARPNPKYTFWYVDLAAPFNAELAVGAYELATRFPFQQQAEAGLWVAGDGRGCNSLTGRFDVLEVVYDQQSGDVLHFAADFEQHCENPSAPPLLGAIRYDSDVPVSIKVPPVIRINTPLNYQGCAEATGPDGAEISLTAVQNSGGSYVFNWTTSTGLSAAGMDFLVQVGLAGPVVVTLAQTDVSTSETTSVSLSLCASDTTPPLVEILKPLSGVRIVSGSIPLEVRVTDAVDQAISQYTVFVGYESTIDLTGGFSRTKLPPTKTVKTGTETMVRVEAQDAHGNVGVAWSWVTIAHDARK
jgi:hypothetical protein